MKKMYVLAATLLLSPLTQAQFVIDFESFNLPTESYNNGSSGNGDFYVDFLTFNNSYDTAWGGIWNGFSISNVTDNVTAGIGNQYSAYPGSGAQGSSHYAVAFQDPLINGQGGALIDSFRITNTTYAALSMRDGDAFGKQFGSIYDANGVIDGTNGEDFFKVWIIGKDNLSGNEDSLEFYLADYRFADSALDYILDEWVMIDLSNLNINVGSLRFRFESSDMAPWGMNTPAYFAVDDIHYQPLEGLEEKTTLAILTYPNPMTDVLHLQGPAGQVHVTDVSGKVIYTDESLGTLHLDVSSWSSGAYILRLQNENGFATHTIVK